jgi:hypothetical protein
MSSIRSVNGVSRAIPIAAPRIRGWLIVAAAIAAGIVAGVAAANGSGPFAGLRPYVASNLAGSAVSRSRINAAELFPSPSPPQVIHQMVPIYYVPAKQSNQGSGGGDSGDDNNGSHPPTPPRATPTPSPTPRPSPGPTPSPGDN